ncbi:MAG: hypothetical protein R3D84_07865 [Paracoccaceae bacterium]
MWCRFAWRSRHGDAPARHVGVLAPAELARPSAPITRVAYDALQAFALHTTVPPSSHSRETGAGAGLTDND